VRSLGLELVELASWYDVDEHAALLRLLEDIAMPPDSEGLTPYDAPVTAACMRELGLAELLRQTAAE
jgi:hypothetical protein